MIIKRCHVINYGTLNNFKYEFNHGLNTINEDNGFGKTTLASFIKSMFYGLENSSRTKLDERKKYSPWNGGKFGGSLVFEVSGKEYRVDRFFGKTVSKDKCHIFDLQTNLETNKFGDNLGLALFGVDKSSFEKSVFFPQLDLKLNGISDNIHEKLTEIIESTKDSNSYSQAKEKLEKRSIELYSNKSNGKIANNAKEIHNLKSRLDTLYRLDEDLNDSLEKLDLLKTKKENLEKSVLSIKNEINKNYDNITKNNIKNGYNDLVSKINYKKGNVDELSKLGLLTVEEINNIDNTIKYLQVEENNIKNMSLQKKDTIKYINHCCDKYNEEDVIEALENVKMLEYNKAKINELLSSNTEVYNNIYEGLDEEKFNELYTLINAKNKKGLLKIILPIISLIFFILSLISFNNKILFIIFIALGLLFILFTILNIVINKNKKENNRIIKGFIEKYLENPEYNKGYQTLINDIYIDYKRNLSVKQSLDDNEKKMNTLQEDNIALNKSLNNFKEKYNYTDIDINKAIDNIKVDHALYLEIIKNNEAIDSEILIAMEKYKKELDNYYDLIKKYNLLFDNFKEVDILKERVIKYDSLLKDIKELEKEKEEFINANIINKGLAIDIIDEEYECIDSSILNEKLNLAEKDFEQIKMDVLKVEKDIERLTEQTSEIVEIEERIELLEDENVLMKKEKSLIDKTILLLEEAKNNLSSSYLLPMKESFISNINSINKSDISFDLDVNLNIYVNEEGESFESEYLSKGYQDLVNICVRLSLVENVFKTEKPVLILDDPFVNLDEKKMALAKELINKISKSYQVIYLICHESREI